MWRNRKGPGLRLVEPGEGAPVADPLAPIAQAALEGDRVAIRTLLSTLGPHLLRSVRRVMGSQHRDVDDVLQESTFAVMEALPRWRRDSTVMHYACRVAVLTAISARRKGSAFKRSSLRDEHADLEMMAHPSAGPEARLSEQNMTSTVRELLDSLPIEQAEVLSLHCMLDYTMPEIAEATRTPFETVRSRLRLAKQALRQRVLGDPRLNKLLEESS